MAFKKIQIVYTGGKVIGVKKPFKNFFTFPNYQLTINIFEHKSNN